ncbi:hypothetical protein AVEN_120090-1 [Araneus ventricosus]|uniref:Uncharacterized protein n=1 Tax=Araneus ventricosus TaxID=182803 RepID=A0A4Y2G2S2_ARAVE|nr:hypothetical protein AVEN_120090-1 [Araneus ventricosus]
MRNLAAENIVDDVHLDAKTSDFDSANFICFERQLDGLAQIADKGNEVSSFRSEVNAVVSENSELQSLREEVANLRAELKRITRSRFRRAQSSKRESSNARG